MTNSNDNIKVLGAIILGAAIGGALGVLFAPDKGSETRKKMAGKAEDLSDNLKKKFNSLLEEAKEELDYANIKAKEIAENGKMK